MSPASSHRPLPASVPTSGTLAVAVNRRFRGASEPAESLASAGVLFWARLIVETTQVTSRTIAPSFIGHLQRRCACTVARRGLGLNGTLEHPPRQRTACQGMSCPACAYRSECGPPQRLRRTRCGRLWTCHPADWDSRLPGSETSCHTDRKSVYRRESEDRARKRPTPEECAVHWAGKRRRGSRRSTGPGPKTPRPARR